METELKNVSAEIDNQKRKLMVWKAVSLGLLAFVVGSLVFIVSLSGELPWGSMWAFILLFLIDVPLLMGTRNAHKKYRQLMAEQKELGAQSEESRDYVECKTLLEEEKKLKTSLFAFPLLMVFAMQTKMSMVFFVIMAVGAIVISSKLKKIQAEIKAHGLTKEDRAELTKNSKAVNKTKFKIVAVMLIIVMFFASMIGGGSSNSSSNSSSKEPWKELGVSKKEYMEIYYKFKYGK